MKGEILETIEPNNAKAILVAGMKIGADAIKEVAGVPVLVIPDDFKVERFPDLEEKQKKPERVKETVTTETPQSFIDYFNHFANDTSVVFCDIDNANFTGIIDYHKGADPAWCNHKVTFKCKKTEEWASWLSMNNKKMSQLDFAYFIENNLEEIVTPDGATMLEIATSLKAKTKTTFQSGMLLANGQTQLQYIEEIDGSAGTKGEIKIPETIDIGLHLFEGGEPYRLQARFRYRINEGNLSMWYDLIRPQKTHRAAVEDVYKAINKDMKAVLFVNGAA